MISLPLAFVALALVVEYSASAWIAAPVSLWFLLEITAQGYWFGWVKIWRAERIPGFNASGFTFHPLAVFSTKRSEAHEIAGHCYPMAKYGWLAKVVRYVFDGRFRAWCEIRGDVAKVPTKTLARSDNDPTLISHVRAAAQSNIDTDGLYFGKPYLFGDSPSLDEAIDMTWREIIARRRRIERGVE